MVRVLQITLKSFALELRLFMILKSALTKKLWNYTRDTALEDAQCFSDVLNDVWKIGLFFVIHMKSWHSCLHFPQKS